MCNRYFNIKNIQTDSICNIRIHLNGYGKMLYLLKKGAIMKNIQFKITTYNEATERCEESYIALSELKILLEKLYAKNVTITIQVTNKHLMYASYACQVKENGDEWKIHYNFERLD